LERSWYREQREHALVEAGNGAYPVAGEGEDEEVDDLLGLTRFGILISLLAADELTAPARSDVGEVGQRRNGRTA
jgi:hypothetical protein